MSHSSLSPEVRRISLVVIAGAIMSILDATIVNVALTTLATDLDASIQTIQWVATAYMLALAAVIPCTGWAVDRYGVKRLWIGAVAVFTVTSGLCALAPDAGTLIALRVAQGAAGGAIMPVGMIALTRAAGADNIGRVMAIIGVPMLLGPVLGPVLGGVLIEFASWHWIFLVNVPAGAAAMLMAHRMLPADEPDHQQRLDWVGLLLLSPGTALTVFGLAQIAEHGSAAADWRMACTAVGVTLVGVFVVWARRATMPLLDVSLFHRAPYAVASATTFIVGAALFGSMVLMPLFFQQVRGYGALHTGLLLAPQGLGAAMAMPLVGRLTDKVKAGWLISIGVACATVSTIPFALMTDTTSEWVLIGCLPLRGIGIGLTMMPAMSASYQGLTREQISRATPLQNIIQRVGGAAGTALLTVLLTQQLASGLADERSAAAATEAYAHVFVVVTVLTGMCVLGGLALVRLAGRRDDAATPA